MRIIETEWQMTHAVVLIAVTLNQRLGEFHAEQKPALNVAHHSRKRIMQYTIGDDLNG